MFFSKFANIYFLYLKSVFLFSFQWAAEPTPVAFTDADDWAAPANDWSATATVPPVVGTTPAPAIPAAPATDWGADATWG